MHLETFVKLTDWIWTIKFKCWRRLKFILAPWNWNLHLKKTMKAPYAYLSKWWCVFQDAIGLELWSMTDDIVFDNFLITDDKVSAEKWTEQTFQVKSAAEKASSGGVSNNMYTKTIVPKKWSWCKQCDIKFWIFYYWSLPKKVYTKSAVEKLR